MIDVTWGSATDRGRVRAVNEDALLAAPPVFLVADGMGGHAAGDVASHLAVEGVQQLAASAPICVTDLIAAVHEVNGAIVARALRDGNLAGMGTTIAGLAVVAVAGTDHWAVFNMGDSRVYRLFEGELAQVTVDHSEVQELVSSGRLTAEEARTYRRRNVVTRSLGIDPPDAVDTWVFPPVPGERFLMCSDGLTGEVGDARIQEILGSVDDPQLAADLLVQAAIDAGGSDNVTVVVVDHRPGGPEVASGDTVPRSARVG